jgi:hypothetical protein
VEILLWFLLVGGVVTVVGHGLWVLFGNLWQALFGTAAREPELSGPDQFCVGCHARLAPRDRACARCGLLRDSPARRELRDLDATVRAVRLLAGRQELDSQTVEDLLGCVERRRLSLLGRPVAPAQPAPARPQPVRQPSSEPVPVLALADNAVTELLDLLGRSDDVWELPPDTGRRALALYRRLSQAQIRTLPARVLLALARLLQTAGMTTRALATYRLLVENHADQSAPAALEAGRLAAGQNNPAEARWFLEQALSRELSDGERSEAERLLQGLEAVTETPPVAASLDERAGARSRHDAEASSPRHDAEVIPPTPVVELVQQDMLEDVPLLDAAIPESPAPPPVLEPAAEAAPAPPAVPPPVSAHPIPPAWSEPEHEPARAARPAPVPRRSWTDVLAAFMESRNILWGELVGGLLIVGCSTALVITLWQTLEQVPYFPFLIFSAITLALLGAGHYTLHHWKLESTSRGLLVISTLLVPLNLVVLASLSRGREGGPIELATTVAGIGVLVATVASAGRGLAPGARWLLALGVAGPAAAQLLGTRLHAQAGELLFVLPAILAVACQTISSGLRLRRLPGPPLEEKEGHALLLFLGLTAFSLAVGMGFFLSRAAGIEIALRHLALPLAVAGVPILTAGLTLRRRLGEEAPALAGLRVTGTGVALAGMLVLLGSVALAWPHPALLAAVCALDYAVLTVLSFRERAPFGHAAALPCLVLGWLAAFHGIAGDLSMTGAGASLARALFLPTGGVALVPLVLLLTLAAEFLARRMSLGTVGADGEATGGVHEREDRGHALVHALGAVGVAALSLWLICMEGMDRPGTAALVCGLYGLTALAANVRWQWLTLSYAGQGLLLAATLWGLEWGWPGESLAFGPDLRPPLWGMVLALEALALAALAAWRGHRGRVNGQGLPNPEPQPVPWHRVLTAPCHDLAWAALALATVFSLLAAGFPEGNLCTFTALALSGATFLLAWVNGWSPVTWLGAGYLWASLTHALTEGVLAGLVPHAWLAALLAHASLLLLTRLAINQRTEETVGLPFNEAVSRTDYRLRAVLGNPLGRVALCGTLLALVLMVLRVWGDPLALAGYLAWVAALWLLLAVTERSPGWFSAFQAALTGSVLLATTAWVEAQSWGMAPVNLADPRTWQAFGISLAALGLVWLVLRPGLRNLDEAHRLLEPPWPAWDRVVLFGLAVGSLVLAIRGVGPGILHELSPASVPFTLDVPEVLGETAGPGAWVLLGMLTLALIVSLWDRPVLAVTGLTLTALSVPVLVAILWQGELATATALRWGLGLILLVCSIPLWLRDSLVRVAGRAGIDTESSLPIPQLLRGLVVVGTVGPVLILTAVVAALGFSGLAPSGPVPGSFFQQMGWTAASVVPLVLVCVGLVGHALRERSPGYAFGAGLVADVSLVGGYALAVVTSGGALGERELIRLLQLATLGTGAWALGWLLARPWTSAWREKTPGAAPLMSIQIGLALTGVVSLLLTGLVPLVVSGPRVAAGLLTVEAGSVLGWAALLAALTAPALRVFQGGGRLPWKAAGLGLHATIGLLACTLEVYFPGWGYRVLLLGTAGLALLWSLGQFVESRPEPRPSRPARREESSTSGRAPGRDTMRWLAPFPPAAVAAPWVQGLGLLALLLALKGAFVHGDWLWSAAGIGIVSLAGVSMAFWCRQEVWAFTSGLGVDLAASMAVCHLYGLESPGLWLALVQANILASAGVALLWLLADQVLSVGERWQKVEISLLSVQSWLGLLGLGLLLIAPLAVLVSEPAEALPFPLARSGNPAGWLGWLLASAAALWFCFRRSPRFLVGALGIALALPGILAGCVADGQGIAWFPYHLLTGFWAVIATVAVLLAVVAIRRQGDPGRMWPPPGQMWLPPALCLWTELMGLALVVLGLRAGWEGPVRPYASAGPVLLVSLLTGALVLGFRRPGHVYLSGSLFTLAGVLLWVAWGPDRVDSLALTVALSLSLAALLWTLIDMVSGWSVPALPVGSEVFAFQHIAVRVGLLVSGAVILSGAASALSGGDFRPHAPLAWPALLCVVLALGVMLWDLAASFTPGRLFGAGLLVVLLALQGEPLAPATFARLLALAVAGYLLLTTCLSWLMAFLSGLVQTLRLPRGLVEDPPSGWFLTAVTTLGTIVLGMSLWACLSPAPFLERLTGPATVLMIVLVWLLLISRLRPEGCGPLRHLVLALTALTLLEGAWACLGPVTTGWIHHTAVCLATLVGLALVYGDGLRALRRAPAVAPGSAWRRAARRTSVGLSILGVISLVVLLGQEFVGYDKVVKQTPLTGVEVVLGLAGVLGLVYVALRSALERGPAGLGRRRLLVYGSELLLVALFVHLKLNVPWLFGTWGAKYWPVLVMVLAYLGVGLGEFFQCRGLPVLAGPLERTGLFLPLLPLLVFWAGPLDRTGLYDAVERLAPGLGPMVAYLRNLPRNYAQYALLWMGLSFLYCLLATWRRTFRYALVAALAANFGLWALLAHFEVGFLLHPQVWLIPLALIVLASEHLNRDRLSREQAQTLRYVGLSLIYVSSTADLFIAGVGSSVLLPIVLAVLSVCGVLLGILLRVKAFLFMGLAFLCLDIFTMIWHAAVDRTHTWVWYVSGIVLGGAIIALFAVFEKRRNDVLRMLEEFRRWD